MTYEALPPDDATRTLTLADPDNPQLPHLGVVGDTYTTLISGLDTHGQYALIDMLIPPGSGPPPHRHDFEEGFHVLEGEIEVTLRDTSSRASVGQTVPGQPRRPGGVLRRLRRSRLRPRLRRSQAHAGRARDPVEGRRRPGVALPHRKSLTRSPNPFT